jgi:hypothetical protein
MQVLFDVQAGSIKAGSERSLFSGVVEVAGVTRRYAALAASCLTLMADHDSDDSEWCFVLSLAVVSCGWKRQCWSVHGLVRQKVSAQLPAVPLPQVAPGCSPWLSGVRVEQLVPMERLRAVVASTTCM